MHRRSIALFAAAALALGAAACSNDKDRPLAGLTTSTTEADTTTSAPPTTLLNGPAATVETAASGLFDAWKDNDREDASRYAKPQPITELFAKPYTGDTEYTDQGCQPQGGQFLCSWTYPGGALQMTVEAWPGGGFVVDDITYLVD